MTNRNWLGFCETIKKDGISGFVRALYLSFIASAVTTYLLSLFTDDFSLIEIIVFAVIYYIIYYLLRGVTDACPKCGEKYAMREVVREQIDEKWVKELDAQYYAQTQGRYLTTKWAKKYTYECVEKCQFCGYQQKVKHSIIDD